MSHVPSKVLQQVHIEDDFYVFGFGGVTDVPRGWGLDVAYINRSELFKPWGRYKLAQKLMGKLAKAREGGYLASLFQRQMIRSFTRTIEHEWHYRRAEQMYQVAKTMYPSVSGYATFQEYVKSCIGARKFVFPEELVELMIASLRRLGPEDMEKAIERQRFAIAHDLRAAIRMRLHDLLGEQVGEQLYNHLEGTFPQDAGLQGGLDDFRKQTFLSRPACDALLTWHKRYFDWLESQQAGIENALDQLPAAMLSSKAARKARKTTKEGLKSLPKAAVTLLEVCDIPLFIATSDNLGPFRHYYESGYLVHARDGNLHQKVGMGLCVQLMNANGAIFATHGSGGRTEERFWHTLMEECTHFTDGPEDRITMRGGHRYSNAPAFHKAYEDDKRANGPWNRSGVLGEKEWAQILQQKGISDKKVDGLLKRIKLYDATLNFEHYAPEARAAENFAALPIIEKAVGEKIARMVLHEMFHYYDYVYQPALEQEAKSLRGLH